ncbi:MAG: GNAT family N-acetyltransferase [Patescibacteria group bacterium]
MKIRKANQKDLDDLLELAKLQVDYHHKIDNYYKPFSKYRGIKKYHEQQLKDRDVRLLVAEDENGKLIGFVDGSITTKPDINFKKIGEIDTIFIKEDHRKKGIGNKLIKELLKWFKEKNIKHVEADVDMRNENGVKAWGKFGFSGYRMKLRKKL